MIGVHFHRIKRERYKADYLDSFQFEFRPGYSMEMALADDLWRAWDEGGTTVMIFS